MSVARGGGNHTRGAPEALDAGAQISTGNEAVCRVGAVSFGWRSSPETDLSTRWLAAETDLTLRCRLLLFFARLSEGGGCGLAASFARRSELLEAGQPTLKADDSTFLLRLNGGGLGGGRPARSAAPRCSL